MQRSQDHSVHDVLENNLLAVYLGNSSRPFARFQSSCWNQPTFSFQSMLIFTTNNGAVTLIQRMQHSK